MIMSKLYTGAMLHVKVKDTRKSVDLLLDEENAKSVGASMILLNSLFEPSEFKSWVTYGYVECDDPIINIKNHSQEL